jgi:hypothetical protein
MNALRSLERSFGGFPETYRTMAKSIHQNEDHSLAEKSCSIRPMVPENKDGRIRSFGKGSRSATGLVNGGGHGGAQRQTLIPRHLCTTTPSENVLVTLKRNLGAYHPNINCSFSRRRLKVPSQTSTIVDLRKPLVKVYIGKPSTVLLSIHYFSQETLGVLPRR